MTEQQQRTAVVTEAIDWLTTPYHHHGRIKRVGVDCAMLLAEVYERCGLAPRVEPGFYPTDWHLHRGEELFMGWLTQAGAAEVAEPGVGDVGLFRYGRAYSHGAVVVALGRQPVLVHAYLGRGVILTALDEEPLQGRPVRWYSLWKGAAA